MESRRVYAGTQVWRVHAPVKCKGHKCIFHNPSKHGMRNWPMNLRETGLVERMCEHGVGHPDPDSADYMDILFGHEPGTWATHGCDGCCYVIGGYSQE